MIFVSLLTLIFSRGLFRLSPANTVTTIYVAESDVCINRASQFQDMSPRLLGIAVILRLLRLLYCSAASAVESRACTFFSILHFLSPRMLWQPFNHSARHVLWNPPGQIHESFKVEFILSVTCAWKVSLRTAPILAMSVSVRIKFIF